MEEANKLFRHLVELRRARSTSVRRMLGVKSMWDVGPSEHWPLVVLIIDEAHTYFRDHKGSDQQTKKLAALAAENARLVEDLVKKGRSVGLLVILTTQKSTGDAIPTFIRDVCPVGLSFAQKTAEASVAALGEEIREWPDANPINLQDPAYIGVASMNHQSQPGFTRIRTPYVPDAEAAHVAEQTANLTADPYAPYRRRSAARRHRGRAGLDRPEVRGHHRTQHTLGGAYGARRAESEAGRRRRCREHGEPQADSLQ
ncbi:hypothetical protein [Streptomyces canus]|uniref:hypothetical protein n=1 Tax=Streptomyces canus TaxID=58343 RepID=UPI0033A23DA9